MTFKAPDSLAEQIAHHLAERIIRGELKPGERIRGTESHAGVERQPWLRARSITDSGAPPPVVILPRRGAQVTVLNAHNVTSLCCMMRELYILLANAVVERWTTEADLAPFMQIQQRLQASFEQQDVNAFVEESFNVMRAAYPFANNPYLEETVENLQPSMSRSYFIALEQRKADMGDYLALFDELLGAVVARDIEDSCCAGQLLSAQLPVGAGRPGSGLTPCA